MRKELRQIIKHHQTALVASQKSLRDIYEIMFSIDGNILWETNDGFRITKGTYGETAKKIESAAAALYEKVGANGQYIGIAMENSPDWIVAFWAVLMSGNKPYLINLRYPATLVNNLLQTLNIEYTLCDKDYGFETKNIFVADLSCDHTIGHDYFADEIAFSSSATSMNEVVCFYSGYQIAQQILNFEGIIKAEPRIAKHYKGHLKQLAFLPFYHVFGLFAVYFWFTFFGRTLVFLRDYGSDTILKTCRRHEVTHIFAVPALWHTVEKKVIAAAKEQGEKKYKKLQRGIALATALQNMGFRAEFAKKLTKEVTNKVFGPSVMFCINGGSYIRQSALELLNGIGYSTYNGYGMSEVGITSVELRHKPKFRNQGSIGRPFTSVEYKIEDGVLFIRGSSLCVKKLINGQEQRLDGWFNTSDIVSEKDGNFFIQGRKSDMILGENGENINPDTIEQLFNIPSANGFSVLGLGPVDAQALSIVVEVKDYITESKLEQIKAQVYAINDSLQSSVAIQKFYFTYDPLMPPTAIKVSRAQLAKKIADGAVKLIPFSEMTVATSDGVCSPFADKVRQIIADALQISGEEVGDNTHIFYDLGATSIQYFDILTRLSEKFEVSDYKSSDKYCYTVQEICRYLEEHV